MGMSIWCYIIVGILLALDIYFLIMLLRARKFFQRQIEILKIRGSLPREFRDKRAFPRVPGFVEKPIILRFLAKPLKDFEGVVDNISTGGVAILPKFPISKIQLDQEVGPLELIFPDGKYPVGSAKVVRIAHLGNDKIVAFKWLNLPYETRRRIQKHIDEYLARQP